MQESLAKYFRKQWPNLPGLEHDVAQHAVMVTADRWTRGALRAPLLVIPPPEPELLSYARIVGIHHAGDLWKEIKRRSEAPQGGERFGALAGDPERFRESPSEEAAAADNLELARAAWSKVEPFGRRLLVERHIQGASIPVLAQRYRLTPMAVSVRLCRARKEAAERFEEAGVDPELVWRRPYRWLVFKEPIGGLGDEPSPDAQGY
jgi:DNA-directed RNA polymerase specialized sigma24 family protein